MKGRCPGQWILSILLLLISATGADAQTEDASVVHWAYSTYFGSGWYEVSDVQDVFVVRYTRRHGLSEAKLDEEGGRQWGIEWRFPVTIGLNHFPLDDLPGTVDPENLANLSVTPSLYLTWPANERWTLRPFIALGWGTLLNGDASAWTYWAGVKSRYLLRAGQPELVLLNSLGFVGYSPSNGSSENFWPVMSALELAHPFFRDRKGRDWRLNWHLSYTFFQEDLDLVARNRETEPISDQWELGLALSRADAPITIWRFDFDRIGLSYRVSSDGELRGIGFVFTSAFDR